MLYLKSSNLVYALNIFLIIIAVFTCAKSPHSDIITLHKPTYNSYFHDFYNGELALAENETVIYFNSKMRKVSILAADIELENCRFRLSLIDVDQDGNYASPDVDGIVLSPIGQDTVAIDQRRLNVGKMKTKTFIQVDREWFLLSYMDTTGRELKLKPLRTCPKESRTAVLTTHWKPLEVQNINGERVYLNTEKEKNKKQLIIVARKPPLDDLFFQKIAENKHKWEADYELNILYMDSPEKINNQLGHFNFPTYFSSTENCEVLNCHANPPYGFELSKRGFILKEGVKEPEIYRLLGI